MILIENDEFCESISIVLTPFARVDATHIINGRPVRLVSVQYTGIFYEDAKTAIDEIFRKEAK